MAKKIEPAFTNGATDPSAPAAKEKEPPAPAFPIVGIGASAGGLAAFEAFFSGMPADADPGMAFVLVQHLAPDHESILADLIRRYTRMRVFEVEDGMRVEPNCAYIIPPNREMAFLDGTLQLMEPTAPRGQRLPIDFFFRTLAQDQHERAICIVLSGTGSDGSQGLRAIKGEGGMVMAQTPDSSEYDGMPRSAIATGLVDYELPPGSMPAQRIAYAAHAFGVPPRAAAVSEPKAENAMKKVFILLRARTGHDFSHYKSSTLGRRIDRRMAVLQIETTDAYIRYMQKTPTEVDALFRDLLIGVTNFFRDPAAFKVLEEQIIPGLFAGKRAGAAIRIWSSGCSTGEEAYSLAMLLYEGIEAQKQDFKVQIFATDIDSQAIASARVGHFPGSIVADVSPERLERFFSLESEGGPYRIHKNIRDMLVFSEQNLIKDPPFSKLDLISCRNLMIYMDGDLQKRIIPLFHYALNPGGTLFLGTSETVGEFVDLFVSLDRKAKIYRRVEDIHGARRCAPGGFLPPLSTLDAAGHKAAGRAALPKKPPLRELTEQALLQQAATAGALVNSRGDILYLHGRTGMYLEPASGEVGIDNILNMAREGLRRELSSALAAAVSKGKIVRRPGLRVKTNGDFSLVDLTVLPASPRDGGGEGAAEAGLFLVALLENSEAIPDPARTSDLSRDADVSVLMRELRDKEEYLQTANEELETANEELQSSNEEMQSVNEELHSTNEELETSKEELQSLNEELSTVNVELHTNMAELMRANNDMNNLLAGTGIGTIFVDHGLRILRFTPTVTRIVNLIPGDVGRLVAHVVSNLVGYDRMVEDTQAVLDSLVPKEVEVRTAEGRWYEMRILPYRTLDNVIEGAVITFIDVSEMKRAQESLATSESRYRRLFESAKNGILILDAESGMILDANPFLIELLGYSREELAGKAIWEIGSFKDIAANRENLLELQRKEYIRYEDLPLETADGRRISVEFISNVYSVDSQRVIQCQIRDISERKRAEEAFFRTFQQNQDLLRELQHRAKNSFNMISGMINIASESEVSPDVKTALNELDSRVRAVSELYSLLYSSGSSLEVRLDDYCNRVAAPLVELSGAITLNTDMESMTVSAKEAAPLGLILTELMTNAIKYAFPGGRRGTIMVSLKRTAAGALLEVADDGVGLPPGLDPAGGGGMGLTLVRVLSEQIDGRFRMEGGVGTRCIVEFALPAMPRSDGPMP
jgi:two-component system CheB/CheR fusion protein